MIKLNNKNITYVALADSNNSLKAPKEIWYADSSNSVKLVYRRKDALIEGEDYEKYHWLKGDGDATITHKDIDTLDIKILELNATGTYYAVGHYINSNRVLKLYVGTSNIGGNYSGLIFYWETNIISANYRTPSLNIDLGEHIITKTTETDQIGVFTDDVRHIKNATSDRDYVGTDLIFNQLIPNQSLYIGYLSSPNIHNLIPCKLLKPVPKWLDANGIRRQVGECGMIDLVSGKFYGNVNSVGTFTVENYYERKEWLVGDGSAYIDTGIIVDVPTLHYNLETVLNTASALCGSRNANLSNSSSVSVFTPTRLRLDIFDTNTYADFTEGVIDVDVPNKVITINDVPFTTTRTNFGNADYSFRIFDLYYRNNYNDVPCGTMKIHYFSITDNSHNLSLIPCTLTMDLPASMDANNIARTKGTSGMWDLVSDRFYGNVANSGTFKAVNLAEGVDYEVHQWLKVELVGTRTSMMTLPVNSYSFAFSRKPLKGRNVPYFITEGNDVYLYSSTDDTIRIWNQTQYGYYYSGTSFNWGDTISIVSSGNGLEVNSQVIPQNTFPCKYVYFGANDVDGTENYTSSITVDGIERYIPVKLLKSIPSKYDANGIARQVGECGMYDTVNDVFYGNVASSGTFSVSD